MIDHELMNGPNPPEALDAIDVDFYAETHTFGQTQSPYGIMRFNFQRSDGFVLSYLRWTDEAGERFYLEYALARRPSFQAAQATP